MPYFQRKSLFSGVGSATMTLVFFLNVYYCIIISWTLFYLISTFYYFPDLPWQFCDNYWNTINCYSPYSVGKISKVNATISSVEEFWKFRVLGMTNGITEIGGIRWELLLCLVLGWLMVYLIVCKGIHRSGKVIWVSALFPYIVLIILFVRAITLPGAGQGLFYFIYPQWEKLLYPKPWIDGATQIFFAYSIGTGALPALGSFNNFHHNCYRDTVITCIVNTLTSILAGCVTFSILGNLAHEQQLSVDKVVTSGPGLVFLTYPEVVVKLPGASAWAAIFFMMLIVLGIDSEFCLVESFITGMVDNWPKQLRPHRGKFTFVICFMLFILGIPMVTRGGFYIFKLMDYYSASGISLLWVCIFQTVALSWVFGAKKVGDCIEEMLGNRPNKFLHICWVYCAPITMIGIFLFYMAQFTPLQIGDYVYPFWAQFIGICISMASMLWIPGYAIYYLIVTPGPLIQKLKEGTKAKALYEEDPLPKNLLPWSDSSAVLLKRSSYDENH
ncbi:sodium- and chloride-dependent GABA transporter 1-like isoform X2 [Cimex lectularius]|uniref:Uncharacterized protein n=1 Tax=Cimex lectularius TaxID=79782 RepID=A0A8I6TMX8_CIMLE|nr:sodium- and chloride-dependent GABA transporter 1-like isoform X2 [Cimex lectularius]